MAITFSFDEICSLLEGLAKHKEKDGKGYFSTVHWQKDIDSSLYIFVSPCKDGTWYCSYSLTQFGKNIKCEEKEDICYFDKDIRNFIKEVRELKSKYIDV